MKQQRRAAAAIAAILYQRRSGSVAVRVTFRHDDSDNSNISIVSLCTTPPKQSTLSIRIEVILTYTLPFEFERLLLFLTEYYSVFWNNNKTKQHSCRQTDPVFVVFRIKVPSSALSFRIRTNYRSSCSGIRSRSSNPLGRILFFVRKLEPSSALFFEL